MNLFRVMGKIGIKTKESLKDMILKKIEEVKAF